MAATDKPNVVFILGDNIGYGDLGAYGGGELRGAPTPRLDQLAREGLRLTQFLVEPACTPSRAALMTGQYSIRNGLWEICWKRARGSNGADGLLRRRNERRRPEARLADDAGHPRRRCQRIQRNGNRRRD
jgi:arylsulfatase A-like enzyme